MFGYAAAEAIGQPIIELIVPPKAEVLEQVHHLAKGLTQLGRLSQAEHENRRKDGSLILCRWFNTPLTNEAGQPQGVASMALDVTEMRRATQALMESEQRFRIVADFTHDWEYWVAQDGSIPWMSPSCKHITGYSVDDFQLDPDLIYRICHPDDRAMVIDHVHEALGEHGVHPIEFRIQHRDGHQIWFSHICAPVMDDLRTPAGRRATNRDITEQKQAEATLLASEQRHRAIMESAHDAIVTSDRTGNIVGWNHGAEALFGYTEPEAIGQPLAILIPERYREGHRVGIHRVGSGGPHHVIGKTVELFGLRKNQSEFPLELSLASWETSMGWFVTAIIRDITGRNQAEEEKRKLQAQLQQIQKMESLGALAGGVAHDMNNVLGAILGLASAHIGTQPYGSPLHQALDTICKATERGGKMVKSLLSLARQSPAESRELDLNEILREQVDLLERTTLAKVCLQMDLETELRHICGDASALNNAFMNLCVNAVDAMPENGTLILHSRNVDDDWIEVVVEDTGTGMPKEVLEKALDPFFTTKGVGKGTGLGLSMVHSTVMAHRGQMVIQSELGQGTRVMLRFPACKNETEVAIPAVSEATPVAHGTLEVLLVDDDELIQSSMQALLKLMGHTVTAASTGEEALEKLEAGLQPDVVILDMNMPGLGGVGTLPRLRGLRPNVPVLLCTGRADQTALALISMHPGITLLSKPFGLRELQKHLEDIGLRRGSFS
jgi:PAS domain S-box-containing protein